MFGWLDYVAQGVVAKQWLSHSQLCLLYSRILFIAAPSPKATYLRTCVLPSPRRGDDRKCS
jgi:hypothetical protein